MACRLRGEVIRRLRPRLFCTSHRRLYSSGLHRVDDSTPTDVENATTSTLKQTDVQRVDRNSTVIARPEPSNFDEIVAEYDHLLFPEEDTSERLPIRTREPFVIDPHASRDSIAQALQSLPAHQDGIAVPPQSFSLAPYMNHSYTLQSLVNIGVDLHHLQTVHEMGSKLIQLDWEKDVKPRLMFLRNRAMMPQQLLGQYITDNPFILTTRIPLLVRRLDYLLDKKWPASVVGNMLVRAPLWLNYDIVDIDARLGMLQNEFVLTGDELRECVFLDPLLVLHGTGGVQTVRFTLQEDCQFTMEEMRAMFLKDPRLWRCNRFSIRETYEYVRDVMHVPNDFIAQHPNVLRMRLFTLKMRHAWLRKTKRVQYTSPEYEKSYVALEDLTRLSDSDFTRNTNTNLQDYNDYQKTC